MVTEIKIDNITAFENLDIKLSKGIMKSSRDYIFLLFFC